MNRLINGVVVNYENEFYYDVVKSSYEKIMHLFASFQRKQIEYALSKRVDKIIIYPANYLDNDINLNTPGKTGYLGDINSKIQVKVSPKGNKKQGEHYIRHEMVHAFTSVARDAFSPQRKDGFSKGIPLFKDEVFSGNNYQAVMGNIYKANYRGGPNEKYGSGFSETMADLFAIIADISQDEKMKKKGIDANTIINEPMRKWNVNCITTEYFDALPLIRLVIASFSNFPQPDYQYLIDTGKGLFSPIAVANGRYVVPINDFFYGIMINPFHLKKVFDDVYGEGMYFKFCLLFDNIVNTYANNKKPPKESISFIIRILNAFVQGNVEKKINNQIYSMEYGNGIINNYNKILNTVYKEYRLPSKNLVEEINKTRISNKR